MQFFLKHLLKQKILAVYHEFHWLIVSTKLLTAKLHSRYEPNNIKSGLSEFRQACRIIVLVKKGSSALHASLAANICLTSQLVRVNSCPLSALFPYGEKFVVSGEHHPALKSVMFTPMWYSPTIVSDKGRNSLRACFLTSMEQERSFKCNIYFKEA